MLSVLGLAASLLCAADFARAEDPAPRAILALFETARLSLPQGPLPDGLRFVLYDDGQIITRTGPTEAEPDPAGRGVTYGLIDRDAAEGLRREAAADLKGVAKPQSGIAAAAEVGSTILEVWDGARYQRFSANAWPCAMEGRVFAGGWQRNRDATDPQFLKVCDRLLQYQIAAPHEWLPRTVKLMISAMADPPAQQAPWPKDWPPAPSDLRPKAAVALCAPVSADSSSFSHGLITAQWDETGRTALVIDASHAAVIWDWYFDLPAPIPLAGDKGEAEKPVGSDCASVAAP
ncbi:hypothetical protein [Dongia sp. agr-C8]